MDLSPHPQLSSDIAGFPSLTGSPQGDALTMPLIMTSRDISTVFPTKTESGSVHVSMADLSDAEKMSSMDFLDAVPPMRASAPGFIPDFPSATGFEARLSLDSRATNYSSSSGTSISSAASLVPSPTMQGIASNYINSSSLSSALDSMGVARSRSGSSASPGTFAQPKSEFTFSPVGSAPLHNPHEFLFSSNDLAGVPADQKSISPEIPADSHLLTIGGLLSK